MALTLCLQYDDPEHAAGWIRRALGATTRQRTADGIELDLDGTRLLLRAGTDAGSDLHVTVDDLDAAYREMAAAGVSLGIPADGRFEGADPQGHRWTVTAADTANDRLGALTDLCTPFAVRTLATLRVPDEMANGTTELGALARACGADRDALGRLLRYLAHRGVVTEPATDEFTLTAVGRLLTDRGAAGQRDWLDLDGLGGRMDLAYRGLPHAIRTGTPAYETVHGRDYWAELDAEPALRDYFDALMRSQQTFTAPQVAELYDWSAVGSVADVGGGSGALLAELLHTHGHLRGTYVDRPIAAEAALGRYAGEGLGSRVDVVAGSFFAELPGGRDVYVVSRALTDWNDHDAAAILRRCAATGGKVLVVEVLPPERASAFDLQMLAVVGGRERGLDDFRMLGSAAGLTMGAVLHGRDGLTLMEFEACGSS